MLTNFATKLIPNELSYYNLNNFPLFLVLTEALQHSKLFSLFFLLVLLF